MYSQVFGGYQPNLQAHFGAHDQFAFQEYDNQIIEPSIDKPY